MTQKIADQISVKRPFYPSRKRETYYLSKEDLVKIMMKFCELQGDDYSQLGDIYLQARQQTVLCALAAFCINQNVDVIINP